MAVSSVGEVSKYIVGLQTSQSILSARDVIRTLEIQLTITIRTTRYPRRWLPRVEGKGKIRFAGSAKGVLGRINYFRGKHAIEKHRGL
jgi:hypothetical protein